MICAETGSDQHAGRSMVLVALGLTALTVVAFWGVWNHDFVSSYDDELYVTDNPHVRRGVTWVGTAWAFRTIHACNWHPLTWLSHMVDVELFGLSPAGHHLASLLLHVLNVLLLFIVLRRMTGSLWRSACVAALFAVHPLHVESVALVAQRKDLLSTCFWMLAMWAYAGYVGARTIGRYLTVFVCLALGLMAKPMLVTLPFVLLLLDFWPLRRMGNAPLSRETAHAVPKLLLEKTPLFALSALSCIVTFLAQQSGRAVVALEQFPLSARLSNVLVAYMRYLLVKTFWPSGLAAYYPHPGEGLPTVLVVTSGCVLAVVTLGVLRISKRAPYLVVGWAWFIGTLVPVIGLVQVGNQAIADRYTYVPLIGIFLAVVWGVSRLAKGWVSDGRLGQVVAALALAVLTVRTRAELPHWRDCETLFTRALEVTTDNAIAHNNVGSALLARGDTENALHHFGEALRISPASELGHYNVGVVMVQLGEYERAVSHLSKALEIRPDDPRAHNAIGNAYARLGRPELAIRHYGESTRLDPSYADARVNLGAVFAATSRLDDAVVQYGVALEIDPDNAAAHLNLANALERLGKHRVALTHYAASIELKPDDPLAHYNLGKAYALHGRLRDALEHLRTAQRLAPGFAAARDLVEEIEVQIEQDRPSAP